MVGGGTAKVKGAGRWKSRGGLLRDKLDEGEPSLPEEESCGMETMSAHSWDESCPPPHDNSPRDFAFAARSSPAEALR